MASITIRNVDGALRTRLRLRAAQHGRSLQDEAREILRTGLSRNPAQATNLAAAIRSRFAPLGGVELPPTPRQAIRPTPKW